VTLDFFLKLEEASKNEKMEKALFETNPNLTLIPAYFKAWWEAIRSKNRINYIPHPYAKSKKDFAFKGKIINKFHDLGVKILAETDVPNPYVHKSFSLHEELVHFVDAGMSPADALKTATLYPAQYLKHTETLGLVAVNYTADLVVLDANPLEDSTNTQRIHAVLSNGRLYTKENLDNLKSTRLFIRQQCYRFLSIYLYMSVKMAFKILEKNTRKLKITTNTL
jgi:adenine deaminase